MAWILLSIIILAAFFKLALILVWTRRLHARHGPHASFGEIFCKMFAPQSEDSLGIELWQDFQPIQRMNFLSNIALGLVVFMLFASALTLARLSK
ncbi:MAG: hypothetical protein WDO17_26990 [Alphaproteobacteria bacterium]